MFIKAQKVRRFVKAALFGDKKSGKTRFALSFPRPAVIDTERGSVLYADKYDFSVLDANHWPELLKVIDYLEKANHGFETLVIDSTTIFYQDLIDIQTTNRRNRSGQEILIHADWGIIKRRWKNFLNRLIDLEMNVVLTMREKDAYEEYTDPRTGEDKRRKTGEHLPEVDKSTGYIFDFILRCHTEKDTKKKEVKYLVTVEGTRREEVPIYKTYNITGKFGYQEVFKSLEKILQKGEAAPARPSEPDGDPLVPAPPAEAPAPDKQTTPIRRKKPSAAKTKGDGEPKKEGEALPPPKSHTEKIREIKDRFRTDQTSNVLPDATPEDFQVLFTRAGQLRWPDGKPFTSEEGRALIKATYNVESTKDLKKPFVEFLFREFGEVLAGRAVLSRDEKGAPFIARVSESLPSKNTF